jgi:argininosuccinate lyase
MQAAADSPTSSATDLAEWLVARGTPFRQAHAIVGAVVRAALAAGASPMAQLVADHPDLGPEAAALVAPGVSVRRRTTPGGAGPGPVAMQLVSFHARLAADKARVSTESH